MNFVRWKPDKTVFFSFLIMKTVYNILLYITKCFFSCSQVQFEWSANVQSRRFRLEIEYVLFTFCVWFFRLLEQLSVFLFWTDSVTHRLRICYKYSKNPANFCLIRATLNSREWSIVLLDYLWEPFYLYSNRNFFLRCKTTL